MKKIVMSAIAMSFAATVANAGIVSVNESSRANIIKFCEAGSERHCSGLIGDTVYTVINGAILELGTARDFAGKTKDAVKADITETITKTVIVPQIKTVIKTQIETVEVVKTEVVEKIVEVSQSGDLAEIARLGQQVAHLDGLVEGLEEQLDDANDVIDRLAHELTDIRATETDRTGMLDGSVNQALDLGIDGVGYELTGAGYAANNERGREFTRTVFAAGETAGVEQANAAFNADKANALATLNQYATFDGVTDYVYVNENHDIEEIVANSYDVGAEYGWAARGAEVAEVTAERDELQRKIDEVTFIADLIEQGFISDQVILNTAGANFDASHADAQVTGNVITVGYDQSDFTTDKHREVTAVTRINGTDHDIVFEVFGNVFDDGYHFTNITYSAIEAAVDVAYEAGYDAGYSDGYNAGYADGFRDGVAAAASVLD